MDYLLAIDQGTTSTRAMAFDLQGRELYRSQQGFEQFYPQPGWVEHDAEEILQKTITCCRDVVSELKGKGHNPLALGITNQRETTVVWDRSNGKPIHKAIVWQDRRTSSLCDELRSANEAWVSERTGLLLDPYFSATKLAWILDRDPCWREMAEAGKLAFGTIESYLIWHLTDGVHVSDVSNASRTLLFNLHTMQWDDELLSLFRVPRRVLPETIPNVCEIGLSKDELLGCSIPIRSAIGDQQSAAIGQGCIDAGMAKSTYGTGCFLLQNIGSQASQSKHRLLTTVAYQVEGRVSYAEEGSIYCAGAAMNWLRDGLGLLEDNRDSADLAAQVDSTDGVYIVPAFTGLGAPHWSAEARGLISGLTLGTDKRHLIRAMLESMAYQTVDLLQAIEKDTGVKPPVIRIDGGMANNDWMAQYLANILQVPVERPLSTETTAIGAAYLAGVGVGAIASFEELGQHWQCEHRFDPAMSLDERDAKLQAWHQAVRLSLQAAKSS